MPILNPQQAFNIWKSCDAECSLIIPFLEYFLPIASENIHSNRKTEEVHDKLRNSLVDNFNHLIEIFNLLPEIDKILQFDMNNAYEYLLNLIQLKSDGTEPVFPIIILNFAGYLFQQIKYDKLPKKDFFFSVPFKNERIGLFISNENYAVLSYLYDYKCSETDQLLIQIFSSVLIGSGYVLVFCFFDPDESYFLRPIKSILSNLFSEAHIFIEKTRSEVDFSYQNFGHTYIYIHFANYITDETRKEIKKWKNPYRQIYTFSKNLSDIFYAPKSQKLNQMGKNIDELKFLGFRDQITINLCNVALYKSDDRKNDWTPIKISGISLMEIDAKDFLSNKFKRIPINGYYIESSEIHMMNPELYIAEPMYLSKQNLNIFVVEKVRDTYKEKVGLFEKRKSSNSNLNKNDESKLRMSFHYIHQFSRNSQNLPIEPYTSQIYAAYQAISLMKNKNKGCILQVHTGEGKSLIVQALADLLTRQGNIVHVATSNIILAARDFENGYNFYRNCDEEDSKHSTKKKRPSILLHQNELEFIDKFRKNNILFDEDEDQAFYQEKNFKNSTNMNISVFQKDGKITSNIIYSTFLNFEAFYLSQYDKNTSFIAEYLNNTYLIIDEADSILIDELMNGTILSKPMNSNAEEVLKFVYDNYTSGNNNASSIVKMIKLNYPECVDINEDDIKKMFKDIDIITADDFCENKKYIIDKGKDKKPRVVPFDSEHKGISEPNKEFSGFIHQFIGIKEKSKYKDLQIQPVSMNYLFISHPIYVNKYKGVCGVTGTIGTKQDKEILKKYYDLVTQKVPRNQMNLRKDLPMILCNNIKERNQRICEEIKNLHEMEYPVLVVFNDINEINYIKNMLINEYKIEDNKIYIFIGKNGNNQETDKEKLEKESGKLGAITLGTNFCGRGISIEYSEKPLFVIVSYYNDDKRSINQGLGRSGRNGNPGLTRIICTKEMFEKGSQVPNENEMLTILKDYEVKNHTQTQFINDIKKYHSWIFDDSTYNKLLTMKDIEELRKYTININRITASKCQFPICMSVETFLEIQSQRIYSLKNCPECKQTWHLFRIYLRELILESWSLFIDSVDKNFKKMKDNGLQYFSVEKENYYSAFFKSKYLDFIKLLSKYVPMQSNLSIAQMFLHIHNYVGNKWEQTIMNNISESIISKKFIAEKSGSSTVFRIGFTPFCLAENSGAKISPLSESDKAKAKKGRLYITDPELRYIKKSTQKPFSITRVIDKIFDEFQKLVDDKLHGIFGLRFFLRRTLAGCEFGICIDPCYENEEFIPNCLIDQSPIIILTICTKSTFFWIAGILIMLLVFATSLFSYISNNFLSHVKGIQDILSKIKDILTKLFLGDEDDEDDEIPVLPQMVNKAFDKLIDFLQRKITENIEKNDLGVSLIAKTIMDLFTPAFNLDVFNKIFSKMKLSEKASKLMHSSSPIGKIIIIAALLIILLSQFILNFKSNSALKFDSLSKSTASAYQKELKTKKNDTISSFESFGKVKNQIDPEINNEYLNE